MGLVVGVLGFLWVVLLWPLGCAWFSVGFRV